MSPEVILNAAAYTAVDRAESEPDLAFRVNAEAVAVLARYASESGACLVHYSTDYVFDGTAKEPYAETDAPNPPNVYGRTKLAGEEAIRASGCRRLVLRTSWIFSSRGRNFLRTILKAASEKDSLQVVADQRGAPTGARLVADVTLKALDRAMTSSGDSPWGTYHLAARGETTWYEYAQWIAEESGRLGHPLRTATDQIFPVPASDYPKPAARPLNSRLDAGKLEAWLNFTLPPWQAGAGDALGEIIRGRADGDEA
jgi:dTDP-4-dehydrorhamnose reductase